MMIGANKLEGAKITGPSHTPKRPKVINLDSYESTTKLGTIDCVSAEANSTHNSSSTTMNSFLKKISPIIQIPIHL